MASGAAKNRMLEQKRLFHTRMTPTLMVTDSALTLNYTNVIFVDPLSSKVIDVGTPGKVGITACLL